MGVNSQDKVEPYGLDLKYERALITLLCKNHKLFARLGMALDVGALSTPEGGMLLSAAQSIFRERGRGPNSHIVVIQRLRNWMADGKATKEQVVKCNDFLEDAEEDGLPDPEIAAQEIIPTLQRRAQHNAIKGTIDAHGKDQDIKPYIAELDRAQRLGNTEQGTGFAIDLNSFEIITESQNVERLGIGVPEIDGWTNGGLWRGALGVIVAPTGGGKSIYLAHQYGAGLQVGINALYATLELPEPMIMARVLANLTGVTSDELAKGVNKRAREKLEELMPKLGRGKVKFFTPYTTTADDIVHWVQEEEEELGQKIDLVVVDYGDKLGSGASGKDASDGYKTGRVVFERLRHFAHDEGHFIWTASQANRAAADAKKRIGMHHIADSMEKVRIADMVITIMPDEDDNTQLKYLLAKNRRGQADIAFGPLPHEFEYGRIAPPAYQSDMTDSGDGYDDWFGSTL